MSRSAGVRPMRTLCVRTDASMLDELEAEAERLRVSRIEVIRRALRAYFANEDRS